MTQNIIKLFDIFFLVNDKFSKLGWTVALKKKKSQTMKDLFENVPGTSNKNPSLIATDERKVFVNKNVNDF